MRNGARDVVSRVAADPQYAFRPPSELQCWYCGESVRIEEFFALPPPHTPSTLYRHLQIPGCLLVGIKCDCGRYTSIGFDPDRSMLRDVLKYADGIARRTS
jgi:hypothetical protein